MSQNFEGEKEKEKFVFAVNNTVGESIFIIFPEPKDLDESGKH